MNVKFYTITDDEINFNYLQVVPLLLLRQRRRLPHEHGRHHRQPVSLELTNDFEEAASNLA